MFVSFLMPHVDRGAGPLFHLIMLLQMNRFSPDEICFVGDDAYFDEAHVPFGEELVLGSIRFACVGQERFRAYRKSLLPFAAVAPLYEQGRSHLDAFQALLTTVHAPLSAALGAAIDDMGVVREDIEAFLSWSNCPSLSALASELDKPVIHNELGPLRGPAYQDTVYFDFRGVNGNTTPATAWQDRDALAAQFDGLPLLTNEELRGLLYSGAAPATLAAAAGPDEAPQRYPLGVALQVEDDSNTLAYGRGYDALRLLYLAQRNLAPEQVLVRSHPGARMVYRGGLGECDTSPSSLDFLQRIDHLLTINSSVAVEAALWEVPYTTLGDTPFSILSTPLDTLRAGQEGSAAAGPEPDPALNALLLGYLVPGELLFDPDYYRWRLAGATLRECCVRHLEVFRRRATHAHQAALPSLAAPVAAPAAAADLDVPHRNPALWSATRSLSRSAEALQMRLAGLEAELATALAERDKNWDERCWFQTNFERLEKEVQSLQEERDTLRLAITRNAAFDALTVETQALRERYGEVESALAELQRRFMVYQEELVQAQAGRQAAEAQSAALLEELHRTQRERIDALAAGTTLPSP